MMDFFKNLRRRREERESFGFSKPLVLLHSDDWGRVGVRDREGFELLRSSGLRLGERPYDLYTLETTEDVSSLSDLLLRHRDADGRRPCLMMYTCVANLDFPKMRDEGFGRTILLPLSQGLPGSWSRPGLLEAYRDGIQKRVLQAALHGTTHFCERMASKALAEGGEQSDLLRKLWAAETPYIFWRMPWVGYEYWAPEGSKGAFLSADKQRKLVDEACKDFEQMFGTNAHSACAPGYRANADTYRAWSSAGIEVCVGGTGGGLKAPHFDEHGMLHIYRNIDFEPSQQELDLAKYLELAGLCFSRGLPLIVSIHSINFHSSLKDFRSSTLMALDELLSALESKYPELLYVNDQEIYQAIMAGTLIGSAKVKVTVNQRTCNAAVAQAGSA